MSFEVIRPEGLAKPSGFSYAIAASGQKILFLAGQTAQDSSGRIVGEGDMVRQFEQTLENISRVLQASGALPQQVAKMTIYVTDAPLYREHSKSIGTVYRKFFGPHYPAMTLVEVRGLFDREALIEVEAVAVL